MDVNGATGSTHKICHIFTRSHHNCIAYILMGIIMVILVLARIYFHGLIDVNGCLSPDLIKTASHSLSL